MALLLNLYLGHLTGDFVLQPGKLVAAKRKGAAGLLIHGGIIALTTAAILWADLGALWNIVLLATAAHLLIELITIRARSSGRLSGLSVFIIDQGLHILSLVILVALASPIADVDNVKTFGLELPPSWVAFGCAFIAVTFLGAILVFEVTNAFGPESRRRSILPYDMERIVGMVERGGALSVAVAAPGLLGMTNPIVPPLILVLSFVPRTIYALGQPLEDRAYQILVAATGLALCALGLTFVASVTLMTSG